MGHDSLLASVRNKGLMAARSTPVLPSAAGYPQEDSQAPPLSPGGVVFPPKLADIAECEGQRRSNK